MKVKTSGHPTQPVKAVKGRVYTITILTQLWFMELFFKHSILQYTDFRGFWAFPQRCSDFDT